MYFIRINTKTIGLIRTITINSRKYSSVRNIHNVELDKIRNIGILAHIDAGKYL